MQVMKIKKGGTRIVFVFSDYVVKIPRIRPVRIISRLLFHAKEKDCREALLVLNPKGVIRGAIGYIFAGFIANYIEYNFYKNHKNLELIIPVRGYLFGLILTQKRAREIEEDALPEWKSFLENFLIKKFSEDEQDLCVSRNFGIEGGKIKLLDYGKRLTTICLEKIYV